MQAQQAKSHSPNTASAKAAETPQKAAVSAASATRVPAWAGGMNDQIPNGLVLQDASAIPGMQAKLAVSQPDDPYEQEADRVAEQVMRMPASPATVQRKCACGGMAGPTGECEACALKRKALQRRATQSATESDASPIVNQVLSSGNGQPLDVGTRVLMEPRFGQDFSGVRVHTHGQAAESAQSVNALAYTVGSDVVFGKGQYRPETSEGQRLLAHELTHVVQQRGELAHSLQRQEDVPTKQTGGSSSSASQQSTSTTTPDSSPSTASMHVSMFGLHFQPPASATFAAGPRLPQGLAIMLKRLIGLQYQPGLEKKAAEYLLVQNTPYGTLEGDAKGGEIMTVMNLEPDAAFDLIGWLDSQKYKVAITPSQLDVLALALATSNAWRNLQTQAAADEITPKLPKWVDEDLFRQEMASHAALLREFIKAQKRYRADQSAENRALLIQTLTHIVEAINEGADVIDAVRGDQRLIAHPVYLILWPLQGESSGQSKEGPKLREANQTAPPGQKPVTAVAAIFLGFVHTQPQLAGKALKDPAARLELLKRFQRFFIRTSPSAGSDQMISETPGRANMPPFPAIMKSYPALAPPLYDAALEAVHTFDMKLQFPSLFDAFGSYAYSWERVRVPDEMINSGIDVSLLPGKAPKAGEAAKVQFGHTARYAITDIQRTLGSIAMWLGPPGMSPGSLVMASKVLSFLGTGIRFAFRRLTMPSSETDVAFPEAGLYIIRCKVVAVLEGEPEAIRPPSVAYLVALARSPEDMATTRTQIGVTSRENTIKRVLELRRMLSDPVSYPNQEDLKKELGELEASLGSLGDILNQEEAELKALFNELKGSWKQAEIEQQLKSLQKLKDVRENRKGHLAGAEQLIANFVSDEGQTVPLRLEAAWHSSSENSVEYYVSDLTTPNSDDATRTGSTKTEAILAAVRAILEGIHGYGRGYCSISLEGQIHKLRIEASTGSILMEAIENVTTAISIAAVIAAPFTAGASLAILVPVGVVAAIPSVYRLASRIEAGTFRWLDWQTAMDIVNIVGALAGATEFTATSMRMVRLEHIAMITGVGAGGFGVILLGAQTVDQIASLDPNLPEGVRTAHIMEIMGNAMLSAGIMVGAALGAKGRARVQEEGAPPVKSAAELGVEPTEPQAKSRVIPEAQAEKGALAEVPTEEDGHKVVITRLGDIFRCSPLCIWLRELYRDLLDRNSALQDEMWRVERRAKEAAGKNDGGAMAREVNSEAAKLERDLKNASFIDLQARYRLSDEQVAQVRRTGVDAPIYERLLAHGMPMDQALGIASTNGPRGVLEAERTLAAGGTIDEAMKSAARTWRPGEEPTFARSSAEKRVQFKEIDPRSAYAQARDDAVTNSALGNDTVPFVQDLGPNKGLVTGEMSRDGTRGWRIDFDPGTRGKPGKGLHVNWWRLEEGVWYKGSNEVVGEKLPTDPATMKMYQDLYWDILSHFPGQIRRP